MGFSRWGSEANDLERFFRSEAGAIREEAGEVPQIFARGHVVIEHGLVAHVADAVADFMWRLAEDQDFARGRLRESCDDAEQC